MSDGKLRMAELGDLVAGAILRELGPEGTTPQFGDSTIAEVVFDDLHNAVLRLVRPHLRVRKYGSWSAEFERYDVRAARVLSKDSIFRLVCLNSGKPASVFSE